MLVGLGVVFGLRAKGLSDELSETGAVYDPAKVADGEAAERNMFLSYGLGAALLIAGGVMYTIGNRRDRAADRVSITPVVGGGTTGLALGGRF